MPYNPDFKGSFLGFHFNGRDSSEFGIVRTMESGLEESLLPPQEATVSPLRSREGDYFISSKYQARVFNINFAFDNLSDKELLDIRYWLGTKKEHALYFTEAPYKVFQARVNGEPTINYVPFDGPLGRVYKGTGTVEFMAHYPYGRALYKDFQSYSLATFPDKNDWKLTANLKDMRAAAVDNFVSGVAQLYNPGMVKTPLVIPAMRSSGTGRVNFSYNSDSGNKMLVLDMTKLPAGKYFYIDSKNLTIQEAILTNGAYRPNGVLYNHAILAGEFFYIEPESGITRRLVCSDATIQFGSNAGRHLEYDYLYL